MELWEEINYAIRRLKSGVYDRDLDRFSQALAERRIELLKIADPEDKTPHIRNPGQRGVLLKPGDIARADPLTARPWGVRAITVLVLRVNQRTAFVRPLSTTARSTLTGYQCLVGLKVELRHLAIVTNPLSLHLQAAAKIPLPGAKLQIPKRGQRTVSG